MLLRNARLPLFLHRNSNHIFTVWQQHMVLLLVMIRFLCRNSNHIFTVWQQHMVLLLVMICQYEWKSYRMFSESLVEEGYYLRTFLQLLHIPHFTTLQKFTERLSGTLLEKVIISSFTILTKDDNYSLE